MSSIDRYAVIGEHIGHSKSPQIHAQFARATQQSMHYGLIDVPPAGFAAAVREFFSGGGCGLNVTVPHKQPALQLAETLTPRAQRAGAVNTLARGLAGGPASAVLGDNTDGAGLVRDLTLNLGCPLRGARVLLLGAGGAARGVIAPLLESGVALLMIHNRHARRGAAAGPGIRRSRPGARGAGGRGRRPGTRPVRADHQRHFGEPAR